MAIGSALVVALVLVAPVSGLAQTPPPSAVDQYVEMVPAAGGPTAPGKEKNRKTPLPPAGKKALEEAPPQVARPLEDISTSSDYGAPEAAKPKPRVLPPGTVPRERDASPDPSVDVTLLSTAGSIATASMEDARLVGLLATMLVMMLGAVSLAARRSRGAVV